MQSVIHSIKVPEECEVCPSEPCPPGPRFASPEVITIPGSYIPSLQNSVSR